MPKQSQGQRPRHVPQRTCVACRRTDAKRGLVRIVRLPEGRVAVDPTGKHAGRGAYLCADQMCWETALKRRALERALKIEQLDPNDREALLTHAATLPRGDATADNEQAVSTP